MPCLELKNCETCDGHPFVPAGTSSAWLSAHGQILHEEKRVLIMENFTSKTQYKCQDSQRQYQLLQPGSVGVSVLSSQDWHILWSSWSRVTWPDSPHSTASLQHLPGHPGDWGPRYKVERSEHQLYRVWMRHNGLRGRSHQCCHACQHSKLENLVSCDGVDHCEHRRIGRS